MDSVLLDAEKEATYQLKRWLRIDDSPISQGQDLVAVRRGY